MKVNMEIDSNDSEYEELWNEQRFAYLCGMAVGLFGGLLIGVQL